MRGCGVQRSREGLCGLRVLLSLCLGCRSGRRLCQSLRGGLRRGLRGGWREWLREELPRGLRGGVHWGLRGGLRGELRGGLRGEWCSRLRFLRLCGFLLFLFLLCAFLCLGCDWCGLLAAGFRFALGFLSGRWLRLVRRRWGFVSGLLQVQGGLSLRPFRGLRARYYARVAYFFISISFL